MPLQLIRYAWLWDDSAAAALQGQMTFAPRLDILPPAQRRLWPSLNGLASATAYRWISTSSVPVLWIAPACAACFPG